jgi:ParB/RepB/Spo0J family partition protein
MDIQNMETKIVTVTLIDVPEENSRSDSPRIQELAADIKLRGLLQPIVVTNGGDEKKPYRVVAGFRRLAALKLLKVKEIPVVIRSADTITAFDNLAENIQREQLHPMDEAQRLRDLRHGEYPTPPGIEPKAWEVKELAEQMGRSVAHIGNLVRVREKLSDEVWKKARKSKHTPTTRVLFAWAAMTEAQQLRAFERWEAMQAKFETSPTKREASEGEGEGGKGKAKKEDKPVLTRRAAEFVGNYRDMFRWKADIAKGNEAKKFSEVADLLDYLLGGVKKPGALVSSDDMKQYSKFLKEVGAAEEAAESEEAE